MALTRTPARAKDFLHKTEPDHDLLSLGFTFENGVLHPPGPCGIKLTPVRGRYLVKIALPTGGSTLVFDIPKDQLKIAFNKRKGQSS
jgi:hypothetical protein